MQTVSLLNDRETMVCPESPESLEQLASPVPPESPDNLDHKDSVPPREYAVREDATETLDHPELPDQLDQADHEV